MHLKCVFFSTFGRGKWWTGCYDPTGAKKKQLHVDKADDDYSATDGYDGVDDYDFMWEV